MGQTKPYKTLKNHSPELFLLYLKPLLVGQVLPPSTSHVHSFALATRASSSAAQFGCNWTWCAIRRLSALFAVREKACHVAGSLQLETFLSLTTVEVGCRPTSKLIATHSQFRVTRRRQWKFSRSQKRTNLPEIKKSCNCSWCCK